MLRMIVLLFCGLVLSPLHAGELEKADNGVCTHRFSGPILRGDAVKLQTLDVGYAPLDLCFDSPGGNLSEGLKFFEFIWAANINTHLLSGAKCESACALAFMGGSNVQGTDVTRQIERTIHPGAILGFHSPSLDIPDGISLPSAVVKEAYLEALKAATRLFTINRIRERGGDTISDFLYGMILRTPPDAMYRIETMGDLILAGVKWGGIVEKYPNDKSSILNICTNLFAKHPPEDSYLSIASSARQHYANVLSPKGTTWNVAIEAKLQRDADGFLYGWAGPFFSGTKYGQVECMVRVPPRADFGEAHEGLDGSLSAATQFVHYSEVKDDPFENLARFELGSVPDWYVYHHQTKLSDLPSASNKVGELPKPERTQTEALNPLPESPRRDFQRIVGRDLNGKVVDTLRGVTEQNCLSSCRKLDQCSAATYDRWNRFCFLKSDSDTLSFNSKADSFVVADMVDRLKRSQAARQLHVIKNKAFHDRPNRTVAVQHVKSCASECEASDACIAFHFANESCSLFKRPSVYSDRIGYHIGIYTQALN